MTAQQPAPASDPTLNPALRSWVTSANDPQSDFPIQNLPWCCFVDPRQDTDEEDAPVRVGMAIGDRVVDVDMLAHSGLLPETEEAEMAHALLHEPALNALLSHAPSLRVLRREVQQFLLDTPAGGQQGRRLREKAVLPMSEVEFVTPGVIGDYTDFYASIHHARNVGSMFRPDNPLLPNYKHVPIGYHGRASSVVVSGTPVTRPRGQTAPAVAPGAPGAAEGRPGFGPSQRLDYELELGCVIGAGNSLGEPIAVDDAHDHIAGFVLLNDWSARDVQAWEYQPLGPFLAKNFATTISPFIVTTDALAPFRIHGPAREHGDPEPLEYLRPREGVTYDIRLEVLLLSAAMRKAGAAPHPLSRGRLADMFWTFQQLIAHHTSNGCNLMPGDLLGSGTISGAAADSRGCMLELTWAGNGPDGKPLPRRPIELPTGEKRTFLEDGDEVIIRGWAERPGFRRVGFGECRGLVIPAN